MPETRFHVKLLLLAVLVGCSADLIAPEDPEWLESCVFTLAQDSPFTITRGALSQCSEVKFVVVNFCGEFNKPSEAVVQWLPGADHTEAAQGSSD